MSIVTAHELDRIITTKMSANVVSDLMKSGVSVSEMAGALKVHDDFIRRVQRKLHSFSYDDIRRLSKLVGLTPQELLFNTMRPVPAELKELFDVTREMLAVNASVDPRFRKRIKKRRSKTKAA